MAEMKNLRFGVKMMPAQTPLDENRMSLYIRGEYGGESHAEYVLFRCGVGDRVEIPAEVFEKAVSELRWNMRKKETELQLQEAAVGCKWCHDEFCTNDQCPMCADYCPVADYDGVCRYEERETETKQ